VVGYSATDTGHDHAFLYEKQMRDLGVAPGYTDSAATSISGGRILGCMWNGIAPIDFMLSRAAIPCEQAFLVTNGMLRLLGGFIPSRIPDAMSADGLIAGSVDDAAAIWKDGSVAKLGLGLGSRALAVNDAGDAVVSSDTGRLYLYRAGKLYALPNGDGGPIDVGGFNDAGQIVGTMQGPGGPYGVGAGGWRAVLISPGT
jgi:probable HAF family extracellular repeat protein